MIRTACILLAALGAGGCGAQPSNPAAAGGSSSVPSSAGTSGNSGSGGSGGGGGAVGVGVEEIPTAGLTARPPNGACHVTWTDPKAPPMSLKATGCFNDADPLKAGPALVPFTVNSPLWSDNAEKSRFMLIPDGQSITVKDCQAAPDQCPAVCTPGLACESEGEFQFPRGTILVKNFSLGAKRIETRLLVRFSAEEWFGHSYKWRDDQTDADLVDRLGEDKVFQVAGADQTWHYPSGAQCMQCHTTAAGFALGPETLQLNGDFQYPNGVSSNQLTTLEKVGLFSQPIPERLKAAKLAPYADATASLAERARAYLHANCAMCHRPGSNKPTVDFRFETKLSETGACNIDSAVQDGTLGIVGAKIIAPGQHAQSLLWARMDALTPSVRMPQLGTSMKDQVGSQVVADWIDALTVADCAQ